MVVGGWRLPDQHFVLVEDLPAARQGAGEHVRMGQAFALVIDTIVTHFGLHAGEAANLPGPAAISQSSEVMMVRLAWIKALD
jgi:hypothetical protein